MLCWNIVNFNTYRHLKCTHCQHISEWRPRVPGGTLGNQSENLFIEFICIMTPNWEGIFENLNYGQILVLETIGSWKMKGELIKMWMLNFEWSHSIKINYCYRLQLDYKWSKCLQEEDSKWEQMIYLWRGLTLKQILERSLHSSRMRTARALTVSPSMLCAGGFCFLGGGIPACTEADTPPPWTESQTPVKTLPCPNFVAGGNEHIVNPLTITLPQLRLRVVKTLTLWNVPQIRLKKRWGNEICVVVLFVAGLVRWSNDSVTDWPRSGFPKMIFSEFSEFNLGFRPEPYSVWSGNIV